MIASNEIIYTQARLCLNLYSTCSPGACYAWKNQLKLKPWKNHLKPWKNR